MARLWSQARLALGVGTTALLLTLLLLRLLSLAAYPLMDPTEGRYGEIARRMAALGDWVTPWFADGVPFWGKPPLAFWLSAGSIRLLGANELAVRLPHLIAAVAIVLLTLDWACRAGLRRPAYVLPLLAAAVLFWVLAGAITTDVVLCLGTLLSMRSFWLAQQGPAERRRHEAWLFFAGLWLALLAKGPVGCVLVLLPAAFWTLWTRKLVQAWRALPWLRGGLLLAVMVAPWYIWAESRTPGFLDYFLIGEHWRRFVVPGWSGDLYGSAHAFPRGAIWIFALAACLPWSVLLPIVGWRVRRREPEASAGDARSSFAHYLLACGLAPCVFFSAAGNTLWTYVLPGLPPLALWAARWLGDRDDAAVRRFLFAGTLVAVVLLAGGLVHLSMGGGAEAKSADSVVRLYRAQRHPEIPLAFVDEHLFSAAFYTAGQALRIADPAAVRLERPQTALFVAVPHAALKQWPGTATGLQVVGDAGGYRLFLRGPLAGADEAPV